MAKEYIERESVENIFRDKQQELLKFKRYSQFEKEEKEEYDRLEEYREQINTLPILDVVEVVICSHGLRKDGAE